MILSLFFLFMLISLVLIIIGLTRPSESAQAIIGFFLMFTLSILIMNSNLEYKAGEITNTTYTYMTSNSTQINTTTEVTTYQYDQFTDGKGGSGYGYWLAIAAAVGMIGVFFSIKRTKWREE